MGTNLAANATALGEDVLNRNYGYACACSNVEQNNSHVCSEWG